MTIGKNTKACFNVVSSEWSEELCLSRSPGTDEKGRKTGQIDVDIICAASYREARRELIKKMTSGDDLIHFYLQKVKLDKGPGDFCLVDIKGRGKILEYDDNTIVFVRGNIAVYLRSQYESFGCMDLACRLDALIVEQMKKHEAKKKKGR